MATRAADARGVSGRRRLGTDPAAGPGAASMQRVAVEGLVHQALMKLGEALHVRLALLPVSFLELPCEAILDAVGAGPELEPLALAVVMGVDVGEDRESVLQSRFDIVGVDGSGFGQALSLLQLEHRLPPSCFERP